MSFITRLSVNLQVLKCYLCFITLATMKLIVSVFIYRHHNLYFFLLIYLPLPSLPPRKRRRPAQTANQHSVLHSILWAIFAVIAPWRLLPLGDVQEPPETFVSGENLYHMESEDALPSLQPLLEDGLKKTLKNPLDYPSCHFPLHRASVCRVVRPVKSNLHRGPVKGHLSHDLHMEHLAGRRPDPSGLAAANFGAKLRMFPKVPQAVEYESHIFHHRLYTDVNPSHRVRIPVMARSENHEST